MKKLSFPSIYFCLFTISALCLAAAPASFCGYETDFLGWKTLPLGLLRLISSQFMHAGIAHFLGNFAVLLPCALYLEKRLGKFRFLAFYLLTGMLAGATFMLLEYSQAHFNVCFLGASGSVYGSLVYSLLLWGKEKRTNLLIAVALFSFFVLPELVTTVTGAADSVAHSAHLGGWIAALFLSHFILPLPAPKHLPLPAKPPSRSPRKPSHQ